MSFTQCCFLLTLWSLRERITHLITSFCVPPRTLSRETSHTFLHGHYIGHHITLCAERPFVTKVGFRSHSVHVKCDLTFTVVAVCRRLVLTADQASIHYTVTRNSKVYPIALRALSKLHCSAEHCTTSVAVLQKCNSITKTMQRTSVVQHTMVL